MLWQADAIALEKKLAAMTGGDALGRARKGLRGALGSKQDPAQAQGRDDSIRCRKSGICEGEDECPEREHLPILGFWNLGSWGGRGWPGLQC